jgi:hypothetical protein
MSNNIDTFVWPADFACTIVDDDVLLPNHYNFKFFIEPHYPVTENFAIGFQKLKYMIYECFRNSVFINRDNALLASLKQTKTNIVQLPCEPYDFYIGSVLLTKFTAITENYFEIYQLSIDSAVGDRVQYSMCEPREAGLELMGDHWWNQDNLSTGSTSALTWNDLELIDNPKFQPMVLQGGKSER